MAKRWNRIETWLTLMVLGIGAVIAGIGGLWVYMSATSAPLHPDARAVTSVAQAEPTPDWSSAVARSRDLVRVALAEQNVPGLSVAVGVGNEIVWQEGFGWADLESKRPVTPSTQFRLGTGSTPLTSAAVGLLLEQQKLKLDEPIQTYVPEFPQKPWPVTLRQVMGHVAGVRGDSGDEGPLFGSHCDRPVEALAAFADLDLWFEPGTQFRFSGFSFILVSAAIEAAAGEPFLTYMRKRVFDPLGMDNTFADSATEPSPDRATPYFPRFAADPRYGPDVMRPLELSCYAGAGAFISTPGDLVRFGLAINNGRLLQPSTVQVLQTSMRVQSGSRSTGGSGAQSEDTGYGLGWDLEQVTIGGDSHTVVGHDGEVLGGGVMSLMMWRERGIVVAVVASISYADTFSLASRITDAFAAPAAR